MPNNDNQRFIIKTMVDHITKLSHEFSCYEIHDVKATEDRATITLQTDNWNTKWKIVFSIAVLERTSTGEQVSQPVIPGIQQSHDDSVSQQETFFQERYRTT